jgi:hypothetical protein
MNNLGKLKKISSHISRTPIIDSFPKKCIHCYKLSLTQIFDWKLKLHLCVHYTEQTEIKKKK